ncbi:nuclear transport factor 2 family protein [Solicola gregarius]|uniref:Nuclear transport factor 2 family protein n=1 Tax=Solicola gregarius TaxID=2908642 RepID=A0AA46TL07_9ACTN|nr:nuclear transport factor 2 family protein [Solicola gregarius]UYM06368.1 nuclear transport factor 2 family protein [Solicola gregarius]
MTQTPDVAAVADAYAKAWNSRDVDAILALHADESTFHSHGRGAEVKGANGLRTAFDEVFELFPGFRAEIHRLLLGEGHWTLDWTLHFEPASGGERGFGAIDIVEIDEEGLVTRKDTYFDLASYRQAMAGTGS